jgi:hypothetical protein
MQKLMLNYLKKLTLGLFFCGGIASAQLSPAIIEDVGLFLDDALLYSDRFITPATDAAVYQASSAWVNSPKKRELWSFTLGIHANAFFVPKSDKNFTISNNDFSLLSIEGASSMNVPTALGGKNSTNLVGMIGDEEVRIRVPEGANMSTMAYPFLQGNLAIWGGTELIVRYSTKVKLKRGYYQVYGLGVQHNISQYFKTLKDNNIHIALLAAYSNEDISFDFLSLQTAFGDLGLSSLRGLVDTYQTQLSVSKEWNRFELMTSIIGNKSSFEYQAGGNTNDVLSAFFNQAVNQKLQEISKSKVNFMGEISARYQVNKFHFQSAVAFGKFVNLNASVQYDIF